MSFASLGMLFSFLLIFLVFSIVVSLITVFSNYYGTPKKMVEDALKNGSEVIFDMTPPADFNIELVASLQGDLKKNSKSKGKKSGNKSKEPETFSCS